jgi:glycosyltransferase involved in cell wall biosynthesis
MVMEALDYMNRKVSQNESPGQARAPKVLMVATLGISVKGGLLRFARRFRSKGWRVDAMARGIGDYKECRDNFDRIWEASWSRNPLSPGNLLVAAREVRSAVAAGGYDLVHVHTPVAAFVVRYALRNMRPNRPKVIYTAHGFHFHPSGKLIPNLIFRTLEKAAGNWTDYLIVINRTDERQSREHRIVPAERVVYMPGIGVDTKRFSKESVSTTQIEEVKRELGLQPDGTLFLMVAEFTANKRHCDALRALALLNSSDCHLAFAGVGAREGEVKALAENLGIGSRVHFLGFRRDVPALMRAAKAVLLTSHREGLPICIMEAMSLEVPVIATHIRGSADLLGGGCGYLVPTSDPHAIAAAMEDVLTNPSKARQMSVAARLRIADFDIEKIEASHEQLYARVLEV